MNRFPASVLFVFLTVFLSSCEFHCSIGEKDEPKGTAVVKDGSRIYNNINLLTTAVKVSKAYLVFDNGDRVPDDNFVDFKKPVRLQFAIDSGWVEQNGKVMLGASEIIADEKGRIVLEEKDLFRQYPEGISAKDAGAIYLSASLTLKPNAAPTSFTVSFRVWDKNGEGSIEGSYQLYSR